MPELPEVQTIVNQLNKKIVGKRIKAIDIRLAKMIKELSVKEFKKIVIGAKTESVDRRAKLLIINLSNDYSLIVHLKLSGQIIYQSDIFQPKAGPPRADQAKAGPPRADNLKPYKHTHIVYYFTDGSVLLHNDMRQFGWVKLLKTSLLENYFQKEKFGPEPLDKNFTLEKFKEILNNKSTLKIKPLLMNQKFIAGIGNIYAQEGCFCAKILPTRTVKTLKEKEAVDLYHCLIKILKEAIKYHGSSIDDYLDAEGKKGEYILLLKVYNRQGEKCYRCGSKIKKITLAGRGTYFCSKCQR